MRPHHGLPLSESVYRISQERNLQLRRPSEATTIRGNLLTPLKSLANNAKLSYDPPRCVQQRPPRSEASHEYNPVGDLPGADNETEQTPMPKSGQTAGKVLL
jgi:hypothetical protein